jgi:N-acetylglucosaminyl-diphospho-decaprenol L-rhamnosyltransferase
MLPTVSITTVLYNSVNCLRDCFSSVESDVESGLAELMTVDNASPDNSAEIVKKEFPFAQLIVSKENRGFAGGCNLAWPQIKGRYWLLLNPDTIVPPDGLENLVKWMDSHPEIGAASPDILNSDSSSAFPGRRFPSILLTLLEMSRLHLLLPQKLRGKIFRGNYWTGYDQTDADWVPGTAIIVRREAVEQAGLLSEELFMYGEDIEWCWRIKKSGWKIGVCNDVKIFHSGSSSAIQTWGNTETNKRMQYATYKAIKMMRGNFYSYILLLIDSMAQLIESYHPFRPPKQKEQAKIHLQINLSLLRLKKL